MKKKYEKPQTEFISFISETDFATEVDIGGSQPQPGGGGGGIFPGNVTNGYNGGTNAY